MAEETRSAIGLIREIGPWIVSLIAILQYWIVEFWKKYIRKGNVQIHETGKIEVTYGSNGPSIALMGTLQGLNKAVFVKNISLRITRLKDNAQHRFNWRFFRSNVITLGAQKPPEFEVVSGFLLTPDKPFKYHIYFVDDAFMAEYNPKVLVYIEKWNEFLSKNMVIEADWKKNPQYLESNYTEFGKDNKESMATFLLLERAFYWNEGEYKLEFIVETDMLNKQFSKIWHFTLGEEDVKNLRLNTVTMLREFCGFTVIYNYVFPEYKSE